MSETLVNETMDPPRTASLLSRYAESLFWLARYMERIENRARILDVTENFARGSGEAETTGPWLSVVKINSDEERFFKTHARGDGDDGARFLRD